MKHYDVISLDIWDTVLRRKCHPDEIKLATARFLYFYCYQELKADCRDVRKLFLLRISAERSIGSRHAAEEDDEYSLRDVFAKVLRDCMMKDEERPELIDQLYQFELGRELEMCYLDPGIVETISQYSFDRLGFISDFYADTGFMEALLKKAGFPLEFSFMYISCEHRLNKRSGRLFEKAVRELGAEPGAMLHIGDNAFSDVSVPRSLGLDVLQYLPKQEQDARKKRESLFTADTGPQIERILPELYIGSDTAGVMTPFYVSYVLWILEDCVKRGIEDVFYFTREGEFFIRIHEAIIRSGLFSGLRVPRATVLEISRVATFAASLREVSLQELMRLWSQYSTQSMSAFAKSVALPEEQLLPWLDRYEIPPDEAIACPWDDERMQALFADGEFISFFEAHIQSLREALSAYMSQKGITHGEGKEIAIVDIGWRGSIQDNLCHLFSEHHFVGYYLALEQFLNPQPKNAEKYGFINGLPNYSYLLWIVAPIEMLSNSPNGSTVGYEVGADGTARAVRKKEPGEDIVYEKYTCAVQEEILRNASSVCSSINTHSLPAEQVRPIVYEGFSRLLLQPSRHRDFVNAFFTLKHNEEFGVGDYVDKHVRFRPELFIGAVFSASGRKLLIDFLSGTTWPQGYLAKFHLTPLIYIYNRLSGIK